MSEAKFTRLLAFLFENGYLDTDKPTSEQAKEAVAAFQEKMKLVPDGIAGPVTERYLDKLRFCSVPDRAGTKCRWDGTERPLVITYAIDGTIPGVSQDLVRAVIGDAWRNWGNACDIKPTLVENVATAMLRHTFGPIDRAGSTLAWCGLPCGPDSNHGQLEQKTDTAEPWWIQAGRPTSGRISLKAVNEHEDGHGIGIEHLEEGNLMAPYYTNEILTVQAGDIREAVLRYGLPSSPPKPPEEPGWDIVIEYEGGTIRTAKEVRIRSAA